MITHDYRKGQRAEGLYRWVYPIVFPGFGAFLGEIFLVFGDGKLVFLSYLSNIVYGYSI